MNVYQIVTEQLIEAMHAGQCPWRKPWNTVQAGLPVNAVSRREYRGINIWLLGLTNFADNRWLSFKQAQVLGGSVRKGEKSRIAVFWKMLDATNEKPDGTVRQGQVPLLRYYAVFNAEQCDGLDLPLVPACTLNHHERIAAAEEMIRVMPQRPVITEGGDGAWYMPTADRVNVPHLDQFNSPDSYYATLFHELGHATGHESRLGRREVKEVARFGSADYSLEELVAELTSAYCCASLKLDNSVVGNSAAYILGWLGALNCDPKMMVLAAARAQRAADFIRNVACRSEESAE